MTIESWKQLKAGGEDWAEVEYKDTKFWAYKTDTGNLHIRPTKGTTTKMQHWGGHHTTVPGPSVVQFPLWWGTDSSCAYNRFKPSLPKHKDAPIWLEWYLKDMDYRRAITCYLTRNDGSVASILPVLVKMGFNQVAVNRSNHDGAYPVYLLVHPGTNKMDRYFLKNKKNKIDEPDAVAEME